VTRSVTKIVSGVPSCLRSVETYRDEWDCLGRDWCRETGVAGSKTRQPHYFVNKGLHSPPADTG